MKKIFLFILIGIVILSTGCGKYSKNDIINDLDKKIDKLFSYKLDGELEIVNNDEVYKYKVESSYKKDDLYKVSLTNTSNNYEQVILKNTDGVYVQTHKSTKQNII